ncbi:MAG TPA: ABC transporter permease [Candidatus Acidoferrales bacterium]|nr:ABC transporter permease [Candidatus Acidoferrales bacterium]
MAAALKRPPLLLREPFVMALETLRAHKLRSFLTLLGIILAVSTLIVVISVVRGANAYFAERIANLGTNVFYVQRYPIITNLKDWVAAQKTNPKMTLEDYEYIREHLTLADMVGAREFQQGTARGGNETLPGVSVRGVTPNMIDISPEKVGRGRYLTESEYHTRAQVAFIGTDLVDRLFPLADPVGKTVYLNGYPFEIVGVAEKIGTTFGQSQDNFAYIPLTTLHKLWGRGAPEWSGVRVAVKAQNPMVMEQAKEQARILMRTRRGLKANEPENFGIVASESIQAIWDNLMGGIFMGATIIVSVFLVVGGIVIMNIMLASVTERTREIGTRKAIGARRRDIRLQFLVESSLLAAVGGAMGVGLALGLNPVVEALVDLPTRMPWWAVLMGVGLATSVGLFFGVYPAHKASKLDPIVALRME